MVILCAHAVVDPGAMVIEALHALVANTAVSGSIGADYLAVGAQQNWIEILKHVKE